jgi:hypothetical protein
MSSNTGGKRNERNEKKRKKNHQGFSHQPQYMRKEEGN